MPVDPHVTSIAVASRSKRGLSSVRVTYDGAMDAGSAANPDLYSILGAVRKGRKAIFSKTLGIGSSTYDAGDHSVLIGLAKPYRGAVRVTARGGALAADGAPSRDDFAAVLR
jgi:hypothetical protein